MSDRSKIPEATGDTHSPPVQAGPSPERLRWEQERELTIEFFRLVNAGDSLHGLIGAAVDFFRQHSQCQAVAIRLRRGNDFPYAHALGFSEEFLVCENNLAARDCFGEIIPDGTGAALECRCGEVITGRSDPSQPFFTAHGSFWTNSADDDRPAACKPRPYRGRCRSEGYQSIALIALKAGKQRIGLLQLNDKRTGLFTRENILFWEGLATHLAVALARFLAEETLRESEQRLMQAVNIGRLGIFEHDHAHRPGPQFPNLPRHLRLGQQHSAPRSIRFWRASSPRTASRWWRRCTAASIRRAAGCCSASTASSTPTASAGSSCVPKLSSPARTPPAIPSAPSAPSSTSPAASRSNSNSAPAASSCAPRSTPPNSASGAATWQPAFSPATQWCATWSACPARKSSPPNPCWPTSCPKIANTSSRSAPSWKTPIAASAPSSASAPPAGAIRWLSVWGNLVRDGSGQPIKLTGVVQDITGRKQAEEQIKQLEEQFRHAQKMEAVGRLAGGIAHDFNNLLMVIRSYTEILEDSLSRQGSRAPQHPGHPARRRTAPPALTSQMLAFSRKQVLSPVPLNLNDAVSESAKMLQRLIGEDIELRVKPAASLWTVRADPDQIAQVLMNLGVNSRDAMPVGGILTLETRNVTAGPSLIERHPFMAPGDYAVLSVTDTGTGISKDVQERMFEPFFTTKSVGKGTGLGLSTVYGIVKQSGGYLLCESEPGQGASFSIYLPRIPHDLSEEELYQANWLLHGHETILIVEDEEALRESMGQFLTGLGYTVLAAESGQQALAIADHYREPIHLMISDVVMPRMSGRELSQIAGRLPSQHEDRIHVRIHR